MSLFAGAFTVIMLPYVLCAGLVAAAFAAGATVAGSGPQPAAAPPVTVHYVANSGMLVTVEGRRFLIDAPIREGIPPYATSAGEERARLEQARAPYSDVDAILVTHWHEDHFSAEAVAAHLASSERTVFISSPEVVERLRRAAPGIAQARTRAVLPEHGQAETVEVGCVPVRVLRIRHNPARRTPEQHVGFLVGRSATVLHVGDADPVPDNFAVLRGLPRVDVALLPFWYVMTETSRAMVRDAIRPGQVVAMHVPPADAAKVRAELARLPFAVRLAAHPGTPIGLTR